MDHEDSDMGAGPENNEQSNEETNNDNPQQADLGPNIPESPLGRVEHKLDEVRNKTDGIPFMAAKIAHNNTKRTSHTGKDDTPPNKKVKNKHLLADVTERIGKIVQSLNRTLQLIQAIADNRNNQTTQQATTPPPSGSNTAEHRFENNCVFCNDNHYSSDCVMFQTLSSRRKRCFEKYRCERCLLPAKHMATSCKTTSTCFYCKKMNRVKEMLTHNSAFCPYEFEM